MTTAVDALGLAALVLALGVKHGFDPDHLVAIDGFVRASARSQPRGVRAARWAGLFFSLGHGVVVTLVGLAVALFAADWQAPQWLEPLGATLSIGVLAFLGITNIFTAWRAPPGTVITPIGLRGRWIHERLAAASHPAKIAAVGAAFALSFDTVSHAVVFSLSGATAAGWLFALVLGLVFTLGMVLTDALNGWWVARMVLRADSMVLRADKMSGKGNAAAASRWMSLAIGGLCLAIAAAALARIALPHVDRLMIVYAPLVGIATFLLILAIYRGTALR
jgi:high-affinity nickel-transport protein